jgi:hypothetical protein
MRSENKLPIKLELIKKGESLSSFGGTPIFLEFLKTIGLDKVVAKSFKETSNQGYHPLHHILSLILLNILGGESVGDIKILESDSGLKRFFNKVEGKFRGLKGRIFRKGRKRTFPSPSRIFSFLRRFKSDEEDSEVAKRSAGTSKILPVADTVEGLKALNRLPIRVAQKLNPQKIATLDMDNNAIATHKKDALFCYKKFKAYQPFNVYWHEQAMMLYTEFRDGNVPPGLEQLRLFKEALEQLPAGVKKVYHRSDSAGYQHDLMEYCESGDSRFGRIEFGISCSVSKSFRKEVSRVPESEWKKVIVEDEWGNPFETMQEVAEVCWTPTTKNHSKNAPVFRYIATREIVNIQGKIDDNGQLTFLTSEYIENKLHLEQMDGKTYKIFGLVTNRSESPLEILLWSRKRCGDSEMEHSRLTMDMAGGRFPCGSFGENAAWWWLSIISLNLLKLFQRTALPKRYKTVRIKMLHTIFFRIAVKMVKHSGSLLLKVEEPQKEFFEMMESARQKTAHIGEVLLSGASPPNTLPAPDSS